MTARHGGPLGVGVVGLGYWGPNVVRNIVDSSCAQLVSLCDIDASRLHAVGRRYPGVRQARTLDEMLADPDVDAVVIATPISTHHELASVALEAGKHVWVEKPLAASSVEATDLVARAERLDRVLLPGHTFLYSPPVLKIKELIDAGELGEIYFVSMSRVNLGLHQPDASVVWDLAPHDFSILRFWFGDIASEVSAMTRGCVLPGTPDVAFINMRFAGEAIAHLELSWLAPSKLRRTTIIGSSKMVVYDDAASEPVRVFDSGASLQDPETFGEYRLTYRTGDIVSPRIDATEPLSLELADFCSAALKGTPLRSSPAIGLDVIRLIEAVEASLADRGRFVDVPLQGAAGDGKLKSRSSRGQRALRTAARGRAR